MIKKSRRPSQEINSSSMADIAFLLLIFFLVTTTIDMDKGLGIILPAEGEETEIKKFHAEFPKGKGVSYRLEADTNGNIIYVNENFEKVSGYKKEEVLGKPHNIIRHPDMPKKIYEVMWDTIKSGKIWEGTLKNKTKNGKCNRRRKRKSSKNC